MTPSETGQEPTETGTSSPSSLASLQPKGWQKQASALADTLAETVSSSIGQDVTIDVGDTRTLATEALAEVTTAPLLVVGLSLTGTYAGTVTVVFPEVTAIAIADSLLGAEAPENPSGQLDEARGQAIESLLSSLASLAAAQVSEATGEIADMVVSDRDRFERSDQLQSYLAPESGDKGVLETTAALHAAETRLGDVHILVPAAVMQEMADAPFDDEPQEETITGPQSPSQDDLQETAANAEKHEAGETTEGDEASSASSEPEETLAPSSEEEKTEEGDLEAGENDDSDSHSGVLRPEEMAALIGDDDNDVDPQHFEDDGNGSEADEDKKADDKEKAAQEEEDDVPEDQAVDMHAVHTTLLQASYHIDEELKAFFGEPLELYDYVGRVITKRELLKRFQGKIVVTNMAISGDTYGEAFTAVALDDAIFLGATLIMLPTEEINRKIRNGHFREDESDAFGEVINIFAGAYSAAFGDYFPKNLRLKKDRMTTVAPTKVDVTAEEPFPDGDYFLATYSMRLGSRPLQEFHLFFPPKLLGITKQNAKELKEKPVTATEDSSGGPGFATIQIAGEDTGNPAIAVLADDAKQFAAINEFLGEQNVEICQAKLRDNLREKFRAYDILGVFLVMKNIDENSLASLIKIRSLLKGRCPIIVAAPKWDRSMVIKAVSYGAKDIIVTPTDKETVEAKAKQHMLA
ncbi:transcriptional regulator [Desulfohalobium retbaense]|uniref:Response regulator receiver protein n=1 Tax=Desulfohalobium retbaense (strain ATCC 49708 / DSM 5692 / JCM 16813 / HR100) TaxID=485915 RepID=C8WZ25_DESRD|nr:transcriptional regulator [Desulfohalobium retbaense]ACV67941.1 response regulator receiver protein [Desulfohalobium retbaense DSM 5692]